MARPPNISASDFAAALGEFRSAIGSEWVFHSDEDIAQYRDSYSIERDEPEERLASAAVAPDTVEQVQQIVRVANRYGIPLYPISTGRNLTYGGSAPNMSGSVVVDLKRMNRIVEISEENNYALVEPGVSYFDLYNHIRERGLRLMVDLPDPGWGSPIGNSLDHGLGYTMGPYRDHFSAHCGMEVVTAEGEVVRTGMGALEGSKTWQAYPYGVGPTIDGLFAQSNFGIVTKMGFYMMPMPENFMTGTVSVRRYRDLEPLITEVSYLEDSLLTGMPIYGSPHVGSRATGPRPEVAEMMAEGWPSIDQLEAYVASQDEPAWRVRMCFYGARETVHANWAAAQRRIAKVIPDAMFEDGDLLDLPLSDEDAEQSHYKRELGIPALEIFRIVTRNPTTANEPWHGHADLFSVVPRTAQDAWRATRIMAETYQEMGWTPVTDPFSMPVCYYPRNFMLATLVPTWDDPEKNRRSRELYLRLIDNLAANGMGVYRTTPAFQDHLVGSYAYNNSSLLRFQEKLKDSIDPKGIISPGRYGLWPADMRSNNG